MTAEPTDRAEGLLVLAGTPLGNLGDAPPRLVEALRVADVIAAEDTRRTGLLLVALGVESRGRLTSYFEGNEERRTAELLGRLRAGARVLLVTDAGMPTVSDPGYRLVAAAVEAGITVTAVPGPSAVTTALAVSGLPVDRFCFEGFLPRKTGERARRLVELAAEPRTMVFFESPHRTEATLRAMAQAWGAQRPAAVCRELTKLHEEVLRGDLGTLAARCAADGVRGEVTLVVAGAPAGSPGPGGAPTAEPLDDAALAAAVAERVAAGATPKAAVLAVAARTGRSRREVYDAVVAARHSASADPAEPETADPEGDDPGHA